MHQNILHFFVFLLTTPLLITRGMELFIKRNSECVNLKKDDGLSPLHLACLNNHLDVATTIAECVSIFVGG